MGYYCPEEPRGPAINVGGPDPGPFQHKQPGPAFWSQDRDGISNAPKHHVWPHPHVLPENYPGVFGYHPERQYVLGGSDPELTTAQPPLSFCGPMAPLDPRQYIVRASPSPLVSEDGKSNLDANAREFTPSPFPNHFLPPPAYVPLGAAMPHLQRGPHSMGYRENGQAAVQFVNGMGRMAPAFWNPALGNMYPSPVETSQKAGRKWGMPVPYMPAVPILPVYGGEHGMPPQGPGRQYSPYRAQSDGAIAPPVSQTREHVSRELLLTSVAEDLSDEMLVKELSSWGPLR